MFFNPISQKTLFCLGLLFVFSFETGISQNPESNPDIKNLQVNVPAAPEAEAFKEYVDVPVNEYTGVANINIPLYTLSEKGMSVPVSLSYHPGGIRVSEEATWVGLDWSLNAGGVITREIRDKDDFEFPSRFCELPASYLPGYINNYNQQIDKLPANPEDQEQIDHFFLPLCDNMSPYQCELLTPTLSNTTLAFRYAALDF
jgi:hypothetical protein